MTHRWQKTTPRIRVCFACGRRERWTFGGWRVDGACDGIGGGCEARAPVELPADVLVVVRVGYRELPAPPPPPEDDADLLRPWLAALPKEGREDA